MAAKKKVVRRSGVRKSGKDVALQTIRSLTQRAQQEVAELLELEKAGQLPRTVLDAGLKRLHRRLTRMAMHEFRL
jgi:hypothetical protein